MVDIIAYMIAGKINEFASRAKWFFRTLALRFNTYEINICGSVYKVTIHSSITGYIVHHDKYIIKLNSSFNKLTFHEQGFALYHLHGVKVSLEKEPYCAIKKLVFLADLYAVSKMLEDGFSAKDIFEHFYSVMTKVKTVDALKVERIAAVAEFLEKKQ